MKQSLANLFLPQEKEPCSKNNPLHQIPSQGLARPRHRARTLQSRQRRFAKWTERRAPREKRQA